MAVVAASARAPAIHVPARWPPSGSTPANQHPSSIRTQGSVAAEAFFRKRTVPRPMSGLRMTNDS